MKILYFIIPGGFFALFFWHPVWGPILFLLIIILGVFAYVKITQRLQVIAAAKRIEPVFIVSRNPETGERVTLPSHVDKYCFHVPHKKVIATAEKQRELLQEAGNPLFAEGTSDENRLPVISILFRDGENVNEEWEDFDERVNLTVRAIRAEWHTKMKGADSDWYYTYHHKQRPSSASVEWRID